MPETQEMRVPSLGEEESLEEEMATYSSILAWKIPWTEEPGRATVHGVTNSQTRLRNLALRAHTSNHYVVYLKLKQCSMLITRQLLNFLI